MPNIKIKSLYALAGVSLASASLLVPGVARATDAFDPNASRINIPGDTSLNNPDGGEQTLTNLANRILQIVLLVVGILAVFYLIYSGFLYITSGGSPEKVKQARQGIINAVIGIIIIIAAFLIVRFAVGLGQSVVTNS